MTARKHLKQLVRARMQKTGESYAAARRIVVCEDTSHESDPATRWHFPGNVPATTALRIMLANAGIRDPRTGEPFTEAMVFGIAGGIGIGVFAFYYEKEDFASFFVAGRHLWQDDQQYLDSALKRFGITPVVYESTGAGIAAKQIIEAIEQYGPCVAWVDMAHLPHRAMPEMWSGGGYHVIVVYAVDHAAQTATIGDLTDDPIMIPLKDLSAARDRIKKQKNRLLAVVPTTVNPDLPGLIRAGLRACYDGLAPSKSARANFLLGAVRTWADRIHGSTGKESWDHVFKPGVNLWRGLSSIYDFVEHYGTGGGLCRPLFADFLRESVLAAASRRKSAKSGRHRPPLFADFLREAAASTDSRLSELAELYDDLGRQWSELADSALPNDVPLLRETKDLHARKAELTLSGGSPDEIRSVWKRLGEIQEQVSHSFPLSDSESAELRVGLKARIVALHEAEVAAHQALGMSVA